MNDNLPTAAAHKAAWDAWASEIRSIGGTNPLLNYELDNFAQIDLERAHPSGMAQFVSSGTTLLNNLIRDPLTFSRAYNAGKRIAAKTEYLADHFGIDTCFLVGGLVNFEADGFDLKLPILMWPTRLIRKGDDFEVRRVGGPIVNPALISSVEVCYGVKLNRSALLRTISDSTDLVPISLLDFLTQSVGGGSLELKRILAVGNFTTVPTEILADLDRAQVPLLNQLLYRQDGLDVEPTEQKAIAISPLDSVQHRIVERALAGQSFAVETLPGCGYTQTVVNLLTNLALENKRVLVLAPRRQTLNELDERLAALGLNGVVLRSNSAWMDIIAAISRNEKAETPGFSDAAEKLESTGAQLREYFHGLASIDDRMGVSVQNVLDKLAVLAAMPHPPETEARVARENLLHGQNRDDSLQLLLKAHELGEFKFGPQDSAWFQARFDSPQEVANALEVARKLRDEIYPSLAAKLEDFIATVEFAPANSVAEMGVYLHLFAAIRESLDKFTPAVFDRSLADVIVATAPRKEKGEMSGVTRRRLKKLAKEFVLPGMTVADVHTALIAVDEQRLKWAEFNTSLKPPTVPSGINDALATYQTLVTDLGNLQRHLDPRSTEAHLVDLPHAELKAKLHSLVEDTGALLNLGERAMVANQLRERGLEDLMRDLARIHVAREHIASEFDLAWWQSALEFLAQENPRLMTQSANGTAELENQLVTLSSEALQHNRVEARYKLKRSWDKAVAGQPTETAQLKEQLKTGKITLKEAASIAPNLLLGLTGVWAMSPYEVTQLVPGGTQFDVLVVLDAAGTSVAENISGFKRANQVIAFGDNAIAVPTGFEVEANPMATPLEATAPSVVTQVGQAFGTEVLRVNYRPEGQVLGEFINREFYQNRIVFEPTIDDYQGNTHVEFEEVTQDNRAATTFEGAAESLDAEVDRAAEVIFNHALWHPQDSLLVATASQVHADRIRNAVYNGLKIRQHLVEFFEGHGRERFEISAMSQLAHRTADRVVFSVGFGRTPQGALQTNLGELSSTDGRRALANLLVSARKQLTVVSCFGAADLDGQTSGGVAQLRALMLSARSPKVAEGSETNPILDDLAVRLRKLGVTVKLGYGDRISMVASYANDAAALVLDWDVDANDLNQSLVLRSALLTAHGWKYQRVYSMQLFSDPSQVAFDLAESLGVQVFQRSRPGYQDEVAFEDTDHAWGDKPAMDNDQRLKNDKPPHWQ